MRMRCGNNNERRLVIVTDGQKSTMRKRRIRTHPKEQEGEAKQAQEREEKKEETEEEHHTQDMEWEQVDESHEDNQGHDDDTHILSPTHTHSPNTTIRLALNRLGPHEDADAMNDAVKCLWNVVRLFPHDRELFVEMQAIQATIEHIRDHRITAIAGVAQAQSEDHTAYVRDAQELMDAWLAQRLHFHQKRLLQMAASKLSDK